MVLKLAVRKVLLRDQKSGNWWVESLAKLLVKLKGMRSDDLLVALSVALKAVRWVCYKVVWLELKLAALKAGPLGESKAVLMAAWLVV